MADGRIVVQAEVDAKNAQKELDKLTAKIDKMEAELKKSTGEQSGLKSQLDAAKESAKQAENALKSLRAESARLRQITSGEVSASPEAYITAYGRQTEVAAQIKEQESILKDQDKIVESLDGKYAKITDKVIAQTSALDAAKQKAGELTEQITSASGATERMETAAKKVSDSMNTFSKRVSGLFKRVLVFSLITRALQSLRTWLGKTIMKNDEARAAVARLKAALLTLAQPILQVVIPAFITLANVLTRIITLLARIVSKIFGTTYEKSAAAAKSLYDEQEALEGVGSAAKKAGKSMASFDEINQLSSNSDESAGGIGGAGASGEIAPNFASKIKDQITAITELFLGAGLLALGAILTFSGSNIPLGLALMAIGALAIYDAVTENWGGIAELLQGQIGKITAIVSAALLALGAILLFSGANVPLGLGLIIAGAIGLAAVAAANWEGPVAELKAVITELTLIVSGALLVIGAILTFTGANVPLGIGLMIAGVAGLAAAAAINWGAVKKFVQENVYEIMAVVSAALLVIGAILTFSGANLPLGIALMAAGAVGLAAVVAINWGSIKQALQGPIGVVTALVSAALLALGTVLAFSGANIPLGIALMAAGAVGLRAAITANWDTIQGKLRGPLGVITALLGVSLLVLGAVLLFTGAGIPLGLGLLAAGGASLAAAIAPNWNFIIDKIKSCWAAVKSFWDKNIAPVFTAEWWANLAKNALNGFIGVFEAAINGIIDGINFLISCLNKIHIDIPDWVPVIGGKSFGFNIPPVSKVALPRLAEGAVIPPNREFMAVLGDQKSGTNIETPLETMVQAFKRAMNESGGGRSQTIILQLNGREFARAVYKANNDETQRVGMKLAGVKA
nr:MAG TPA: minor tail protein [Caudoviricetes sp.]